jgi:hypothetical protein
MTHEPGLSETEVEVMRRVIVAAATDAHHFGWSPWPRAIGGTMTLRLFMTVFKCYD